MNLWLLQTIPYQFTRFLCLLPTKKTGWNSNIRHSISLLVTCCLGSKKWLRWKKKSVNCFLTQKYIGKFCWRTSFFAWNCCSTLLFFFVCWVPLQKQVFDSLTPHSLFYSYSQIRKERRWGNDLSTLVFNLQLLCEYLLEHTGRPWTSKKWQKICKEKLDCLAGTPCSCSTYNYSHLRNRYIRLTGTTRKLSHKPSWRSLWLHHHTQWHDQFTARYTF